MLARRSIPAALVVMVLVGQAMGAIGIFDGSLDLGHPGIDPALPGSAVYGAGMYTVTGGGSDWWDNGERAHFVHKRIGGAFRIEADVVWQGLPTAGNEWKKAGVAIRNDIDTGTGNAKEINFITVATRPDMNRGSFQFRLDAAENMGNIDIVGTQPTRVALQRCYDAEGDAFVEGFVYYGGAWVRVDGRWAFNLNNIVYVGLFVTSHDNLVTETADFTNVQFVPPICPTAFPRKPGRPVSDGERVAPVAGGWGVLEVVDNGTMGSVGDAITSLQSPTGTRHTYDLMGPINISDTSPQADAKNFPGDGPYGVVSAMLKPAGAVNHIAFLARGQVHIPESDFWSFYINSDDGDELSVDDGALTIGSESWSDDSFGSVWLTAGPHNVQVLHREHAGGADVEVAAARGETTDLYDFRLIGSGDPGLPPVPSLVPGLVYDPWIHQSLPGESGMLTNLNQAWTAMLTSTANGTDSVISDIFVNHSDPDNPGGGNSLFAGDHDYPYDQLVAAGTPDDDFAVFILGEIWVSTPGTYYIGFNSDDGAQLTILGLPGPWLSIVEDATGNALITSKYTPGDTLVTDGFTGWSLTVGEIYLPAGGWPFEMLIFERNLGAFVELFGGSVPGAYGLLMTGPERTIVKPAVAPALDLVLQEPWCRSPVIGDLNNDCKNDFFDFAIYASHWLDCNRLPVSMCP